MFCTFLDIIGFHCVIHCSKYLLLCSKEEKSPTGSEQHEGEYMMTGC